MPEDRLFKQICKLDNMRIDWYLAPNDLVAAPITPIESAKLCSNDLTSYANRVFRWVV